MAQNSYLPVAILLLLVLMRDVMPSKILVLSFVSTKSHKITYMPLLEELASRGHQITIVSPIRAEKEIKNINEVFTLDAVKRMEERGFEFNIFEMKEKGQAGNPLLLIKEFAEICRMTYDLEHVKEILKQDYDLVFMQPLFNECVLGIVYRLKIPLVLFTPTGVPDLYASKLGGHFPPSFVSNPFLGYPDEMTFFQRFLNFGSVILMNAVVRFYYEPIMAQIYWDKLGENIPLPNVILRNASLILSNGHFSTSRPKPYLPDIVDVGGLHSRPANPLPKELEDFIAKGKDGFILFSMGSAIKGDMMPEDKRKMFINVFSKLKQQVLWKWETETMPDLPKNVKLNKWLPQQDLLGHPQIKMFITHCGGGSTEEAIYHGVPLLGMPMMGDQPMNAKNAKNNGFLVHLDWNELDEDRLMSGILEVLNNPSYRGNVRRLSTVFRDQPDEPLKRGVYWVEYVLRHQGAVHLRSAGRNLNYFQYHSWDVIATYLAIITVTFKTLLCITKLIYRKLWDGVRRETSLSRSGQKKSQ